MDNFFSILPFLVPLLVGIQLYRKYKEKDKLEKDVKVSKLRQYWLDSYIRLIFIERGVVKFFSAIWYPPLLFCIVFGGVWFIGHYKDSLFPPLVLEEMHTQNGVIQSISLRRKMKDLLVLSLENGNNKEFSINSSSSEIEILLNKKVKIWFMRDWSSGFTIDDVIYEVTVNGKSIRKYKYDYYHRLETIEQMWMFTKYCFYIGLFSIFMIWIQNRKELPAHRLHKMRLYKKNKGQK